MIDNGIGYSVYTSQKNNLFREIIKMNISAWKSNIKKFNIKFPYTYFDINAGVGIHKEYGVGSPIIFLEEINDACLPYRANFFEIDEFNAMELRINTSKHFPINNANIYNGDHSILLRNWIDKQSIKHIPGLLYCDPTGKLPPFDLIAEFSNIWRSTDILINFSATNIKRADKYNLIDKLKLFSKKSLLIREPFGCHQWTFIYLTNGPAFEWKKQGLHLIDSPSGKMILERLNHTIEELRNKNEKQLSLFELC